MQTKKILAFTIALGLSTNLYASNDFDMGKVQIVGKDAQEEKIDPAKNSLSMDIGERSYPMPELIPETGPQEFKPMTEKQILNNFHRESKEEISVSAGLGTRGSNELIINGKGERAGYIGDIIIRRETRDGYKSFYDTRHSGLKAVVTSTGEGSYILSGAGEYSVSKQAQRGTKTIPTPDAGFEDSVSRISLVGNSTLEDGAFFKGHASIDSISRNITNSKVAFNEDQTVFSLKAGASYNKKLTDKFRGVAAVDLKSDKFTVSNGKDRKLTKTVLDLGGDYEVSEKANLKFGFKAMSLMEKDRTSPYASIDYRWAKPWQAYLAYDEDLCNDSLEQIFMPSRYVVANALKASRTRTWKGGVNYKTNRGDTLGVEFFSQREADAIEYLDAYDPGKAMLTSTFRFVNDVRRRGTTLRGTFKLEKHFKFKISTTYQTPEDDATGRRISYEPEKILDVGLNYTEGKFMIDFTRRAEFNRTAHTTTASFGADDYSRADLAVRYKMNQRFSAYLKIKDLYDEASEIRYNVPEEGRVTLAGIEAHF
ncbi:MAG: hypothetical protein Kow0029_18230 [Candidatus Rifleibacteriota bacterium]